MIMQTSHPQLNNRQDTVVRFLGFPTAVRATSAMTNGAYGLIESWEMPPGFTSPYHVHHREDESFYVVEGEMAFVVDGEWLKAGPGTYLFGPREIPHGFKVIGDKPARLLLWATPAGFESFVLELSQPMSAQITEPDMAKLMQVAAKHNIDILGPLPES
jgi:quercetin dioxygenase-like cupin family protein